MEPKRQRPGTAQYTRQVETNETSKMLGESKNRLKKKSSINLASKPLGRNTEFKIYRGNNHC